MATFTTRFLGCKVSHTDAEAIREALLRDGHREAPREADVAARAARTHARVYVTGCAANLADAFDGLPPNVRVIARPSEATPAAVAGDVGAIGCIDAAPRLGRTRAFVKIQDGCSFSCSFCVVPLVRGRSRSRAADAVVAEVRRRVAHGHR